MGVRAVFVAWMVAVAGVAVLAAAVGLASRQHDWRAASRAEDGIETLSQSLRVVEFLSLERGASISALLRPTPFTTAHAAQLASDRGATDAALAATRTELAESSLFDRDRVLAMLGQAEHQLRELRQSVDGLTPLAPAGRDAAAYRNFLLRVHDIQDQLKRINSVLEGSIARADPMAGPFASIARVATDLREFAGRQGTIYVGILAGGRAVSEDQAEQLAEMSGRIDQEWSRLTALIEQSGAEAALTAKAHEVERGYFGASRKLYVDFLNATQGNPPLSVDMFRARQAPLLRQILPLRDAALERARNRAGEDRTRAQNSFLIAGGMALATIALGVVAATLVGRRVVFPLLSLTRTIVRLAAGDRAIEVPERNRGDEIGAMARAIETLRRNAILADEAMLEHTERQAGRQRELEHARALAESANDAKNAFLANMSHELRTPLNAVIGFSEIIERQILGPVGVPAYAEYAKDIHDSAGHLLQLINEILDMSTLDAGRMTLAEELCDPETLFASCLRMLGPNAERGGVSLTAEIHLQDISLRCDERRMRQVLLNLLSNAVKYTRPGGQAKLRALLASDGSLELAVSDTGIGIAAEDMALVMEAFHRVESTLNRSIEGTGLGLPLTKRLVEMHGGSLILESQPGRGTTATVRLPAERIFRTATAVAARATS